ncbi:MAG TPA: rhodanese-like domain-containing protein [Spirochaetes bacterium]|nr:rhodanese-like domain-containing protein [Spirochaetota bacterium]
MLKDVSAEGTLELIEENAENPDFVILDVRTPSEFKDGHLENAENLDYYADTFKDELGKLDKNKTYLIYCKTGNRSGKSLKIMDEMGFTKVYNMLGGFKDWSSKGLPFVK